MRFLTLMGGELERLLNSLADFPASKNCRLELHTWWYVEYCSYEPLMGASDYADGFHFSVPERIDYER